MKKIVSMILSLMMICLSVIVFADETSATDNISDFKKPIHLSEITISAYSNSDEDLAIQTEIAKNI